MWPNDFSLADSPNSQTIAKKGARKTVALVLGSGGARGYAHIGVIEEIQKRGFDIIGVAGCSMGAVIGGFFAAGKLKEYSEWAQNLTHLEVLKLVDISLLTSGAIRGDKLFNHLKTMLGDVNIEDLSLPFTAVATDLTKQKEIWFQRGPLDIAMRASSAIPSLIKPVMDRGRLLVDGAVLNPLPISAVVSVHADYIIAVDASADRPMPKEWDEIRSPKAKKEEEEANRPEDRNQWLDGVASKLSQWFTGEADETTKAMDDNLGKLEVMYEMFETMQMSLTQYKIAGYPPDLLINVPQESLDIYEFYRATEQIELGRYLADKALNKFEQKLNGDLVE